MSKPGNDFEVVVLGAGIAGLLIASELSRDHKLLLIEKNATITSHKYWLTDQESADLNPEIASAIDLPYSSLDFIAYDGRRHRCFGKYVLWDTDRLIGLLLSKIRNNGGEVLAGQTFYSYKTTKHAIEILANDGAFSADLAIDCMGYGSPIIYAKGIVDIIGYYMLYGATFQAQEQPDPVGLHNMTLSPKPSYIEAFPASDGRLHLILILPSVQSTKPTALRDEFDFLVNRSPYRRFIAKTPADRSFLGGIIPVGKLRRRALDRLFFFGESGQANPAATATGLTRMLHSYKKISLALSERLKEEKLSAAQLTSGVDVTLDQFNRRLHAALFKSILKWDSDHFARIVDEMNNAADPDLVNEIMFGKLAVDHRLLLKTFPSLARHRSVNILRSLIRGFMPP